MNPTTASARVNPWSALQLVARLLLITVFAFSVIDKAVHFDESAHLPSGRARSAPNA